MSEKDLPTNETGKKREKTIDLSEWQRKNKAYLEKRAKEKAEQAQREKDLALQQEETETEVTLEAGEKTVLESSDEVSELADEVAATEDSETEEAVETESEAEAEDEDDADSEEDDATEKEVDAEEESETASSETAEIADNQTDAEDKVATDDKEKFWVKKKVKKQSKEISPEKQRERRRLYKLFPIYFLSGLAVILALYFILPVGRLRQITVKGNAQVSATEVLDATGISEQDYTLTTYFNQARHAKNIKNQLVWVKDAEIKYAFPTKFQVTVEEHRIIGYIKEGANYYPVLSSGQTLDAPVTEEQLPEKYMLIKINDLEMVKQFVVKLSELDLTEMSDRIETVELVPSSATADLLTLTMRDGHTVFVPLAEISTKMAYYDKIGPKLLTPSYIDMEAGIYTYAK